MGGETGMRTYFSFELAFFINSTLMFTFQSRVFFLKFLALKPSPSVLEPNSYLAWIKPKFSSKSILPLRFQFMFILKMNLKHVYLLISKFPLPEPTARLPLTILAPSSWFYLRP